MLLRLINSDVSDREVRIGCNGGYTRFWTDATHGYLFENGSVISRNGKISSFSTESDLILCTTHGTQERMRISRTTSYVGIGINSPETTLHIKNIDSLNSNTLTIEDFGGRDTRCCIRFRGEDLDDNIYENFICCSSYGDGPHNRGNLQIYASGREIEMICERVLVTTRT